MHPSFLVPTSLITFALLSWSTPVSAQKGDEAQAQMGASESLPSGFRGRISYRGTYEGRVTRPGPPLRQLNLRSILQSATGGSVRDFAGGYTMDLQIDGNAVTGRYGGTGGIDGGSVSGTRSGNRCRLFDDRSGSILEAECTTDRFAGHVQSRQGANPQFTMSVEAETTQLVDAVQEERQRQLAFAQAQAQRQQQAADTQRQAEAEAALIRSRPHASAIQANLMERAIRQDSTNWLFNRYDFGSLTDVRVMQGGRGEIVLRGNYTFNGGAQGWVLARVTGNRVDCLQFWDMGGCSAPRLARAVGRGGGGQTGGADAWAAERARQNGDAGQYQAWQQEQDAERASSQPAPPPPTPVEPIGGDRGLYGSDHSCCRN